MRIALVTTPAGGPVADYTAALLPHLRRGHEVELFVEPGREGEELSGLPLRSLTELDPRAHDQVLYQLGNERQHGFMLPALRALGGTVVLHDWVLSEAACGAYAELERGGWRGLGRALAEGGLAGWAAYGAARTDDPAASPRSAGLLSSMCSLGSRRRTPGTPQAPTLNRSAVRFGDAFLIHDEALAQRILRERNEHTAIAVLPAAASSAPADEQDLERLARAYTEALEHFPHARSARRSLLVLAFRARTAAREGRRTARAEAARSSG